MTVGSLFFIALRSPLEMRDKFSPVVCSSSASVRIDFSPKQDKVLIEQVAGLYYDACGLTQARPELAGLM